MAAGGDHEQYGVGAADKVLERIGPVTADWNILDIDASLDALDRRRSAIGWTIGASVRA